MLVGMLDAYKAANVEAFNTGVAEYFNIDPPVVRLLLVLLAFMTAGVPVVLLYVILWIIMPRNPGV